MTQDAATQTDEVKQEELVDDSDVTILLDTLDDEWRMDETNPAEGAHESDSDATTLGDLDTSSDRSYIDQYELDPTYEGPAYPSQPCSKHGASYKPPGWKKRMVKRKKLDFEHASSES